MFCRCREPRWFVGDPTSLARDNILKEYNLEDWAGLPQTTFADMPTKLEGGQAREIGWAGCKINMDLEGRYGSDVELHEKL